MNVRLATILYPVLLIRFANNAIHMVERISQCVIEWYYLEMFGYLAPSKRDLKIWEFDVYNAYYCAICHAVKRRYGELPRLLLSYDAVLVAMLTENLVDRAAKPEFSTFRCLNNPLKKRNEVAPSYGIEYAADVMVFLGWLSLKDKKEDKDGANIFKEAAIVAGEKLLKRAGLKAAERLGEKANICFECIEEQSVLESAREVSVDKAADPTGRMMEELLDVSVEASSALREMGYHLGRYIYIIDAADDIEKDRESGTYNPLLLKPIASEALKTAISLDLARVCDFADQLDLVNHKSIIDNIFYLGLRAKMDEVIGVGGGKDD